MNKEPNACMADALAFGIVASVAIVACLSGVRAMLNMVNHGRGR